MRLDAVRVLAHDDAVLPHVGVQRLVAARVGHVEAGRDDADGAPATGERSFVRGAVDAEREPADDGDPRGREVPADLARVGEPVAVCALRVPTIATRGAVKASSAAPSPNSTGGRPGIAVADRVVVVAVDPHVGAAPLQPSAAPVPDRLLPPPHDREIAWAVIAITAHGSRSASPSATAVERGLGLAEPLEHPPQTRGRDVRGGRRASPPRPGGSVSACAAHWRSWRMSLACSTSPT